jgi:hypothetical protein
LIDSDNDLLFCKDECVKEYFEETITKLQNQYLGVRLKADIPLEKLKDYENYLQLVLNDPDEVWEVEVEDDDDPVFNYIGEFLTDHEHVFYVAQAYVADGEPSFVYIHFPTTQPLLVATYRQGRLIYDSSGEKSSVPDMEMNENNIAFEFYQEMLENRSANDIDPEDFDEYQELKVKTIESPSEVWEVTDPDAVTFLVFIASFNMNNEIIFYVVIAINDELSENMIPVFGFPTIDPKLVERFRKGEKLQYSSTGNT